VTELDRLNAADHSAVVAELLACNASRRWAEQLAARRPYATIADLGAASDEILALLDEASIADALAAHPRIGQRAAGHSREAAWSRREQSGAASAPADVTTALVEGNRAYEERFGHVFLICATGLSADQMLTDLRRRLHNEPDAERRVVRAELAKITRLRLEKLVNST
jgi:2-oxo-4-hydroxy-4-carboxy-5-ureidoimidazoline decarboxylase